MGRDYVIDHCVSVLNEQKKEEFYRVYVTEMLRLISKGNGYEVKLSYADYMKRLTEPEHKTETPEDVINRIRSKVEAL